MRPKRILLLCAAILLVGNDCFVAAFFRLQWPQTKVLSYRGRARPVRAKQQHQYSGLFRPYRVVVEQKPVLATSRSVAQPITFRQLRQQPQNHYQMRPQQQQTVLAPVAHQKKVTTTRRSDEDGELIIEEEDFYDTGQAVSVDDDGKADVHIHLKSLIDPDLVQFLLTQLPWEDLLSGNKLSRTEEGYSWQGEGQQGETWQGHGEGERSYTSNEQGMQIDSEQERRQITQTHEIQIEMCPDYFSKYYPQRVTSGRARTSLLGYMECEREKNFGAHPFHHYAQDRHDQERENAPSESTVARMTWNEQKSPVEERLSRFRNYVRNAHGQ